MPKMTKIQSDKIKAMVSTGKTDAEIADELGVSRRTILRYRDKCSITKPRGGARAGAGRKKSAETCRDINAGDRIVYSDTAVGRVHEKLDLKDISEHIIGTVANVIDDYAKKDILNQLITQLDELLSQIHSTLEEVIGNKIPISLLEKKYFDLVHDMLKLILSNNKINYESESYNDEQAATTLEIENENENNEGNKGITFERPPLPLDILQKSRPEISKEALVRICRSIYQMANAPLWDGTLTKVLEPETWACKYKKQVGLGDYKHYPIMTEGKGNYKKKKNGNSEKSKTEIA